MTGVACNAHTFVFMPNARMIAQVLAPHIAKAYGTRWYMITAATVDGKAAAQVMLDAGKPQDVDFVGETVAGKLDQTPVASQQEVRQVKGALPILKEPLH